MKSALALPKKIPFTKEGFLKLQTDLEAYTLKRKEAVVRLRTAREMGDLSENGAYKAAWFELSDIDRTMRRLNYLLRFGEVVEKQGESIVDFGSRVTLESEKGKLSFDLVGGYESNPTEEKLSVNSPIGQAVLNKRVGDKVFVNAPAGKIVYVIKEIS